MRRNFGQVIKDQHTDRRVIARHQGDFGAKPVCLELGLRRMRPVRQAAEIRAEIESCPDLDTLAGGHSAQDQPAEDFPSHILLMVAENVVRRLVRIDKREFVVIAKVREQWLGEHDRGLTADLVSVQRLVGLIGNRSHEVAVFVRQFRLAHRFRHRLHNGEHTFRVFQLFRGQRRRPIAKLLPSRLLGETVETTAGGGQRQQGRKWKTPVVDQKQPLPQLS